MIRRAVTNFSSLAAGFFVTRCRIFLVPLTVFFVEFCAKKVVIADEELQRRPQRQTDGCPIVA